MHNWFNQTESKLFWHAQYKCLDKACDAKYEASIAFFDEKSPIVSIDIFTIKASTHEYLINKKARITGIKRKELAIKICADGVAMVQCEEINNNSKQSTFYVHLLSFLTVSRTHTL